MRSRETVGQILHVSRAKFGAPPYLAHFDAVNKQLTISLDSDVLHALTVSSRSVIAYSVRNAMQYNC